MTEALDRKIIELDRSKKRFTLYRDLAATGTKEMLVKNLLGHKEASAFYGAPSSAKSAVVEDMALHIAAGMAWHGREVKQGKGGGRRTRLWELGYSKNATVQKLETAFPCG